MIRNVASRGAHRGAGWPAISGLLQRAGRVRNLGGALVLLLLAMPALAQYAGPALLTRGEAPAAMSGTQLSFRPFLDVTAIYDTGLAGVVSTGPQGGLADASSAGVQFAGGITGSRSWRHTKLGLDYRGSIDHYSRQTYYDSTNQSLMLGVTHQVSRHVNLMLRETAGIFSRDYGLLGLSQALPYDPSQSYIPTTDFFDNRTYYLSSQADLTIQKSLRLSFNLGGDAYVVRRRSSALYGVTGEAARGDVQYRISRRSTLGLGYTFSRFAYNNIANETDLHSAVLSYSVRLTKTVEFSALAGGMRVESKLIETVPVDPKITELFGFVTGPRQAYNTNYLPTYSARLSRTFEKGVVFAMVSRTITPGNGLFLTSNVSTYSGGYNYTGIRRWSFNVQAGYDDANSLQNITGRYRDYSGGFSVSREVLHSFHLVAGFTARQYDSPSFSRYNRLIYESRLGFGWAPGDVPVRVW